MFLKNTKTMAEDNLYNFITNKGTRTLQQFLATKIPGNANNITYKTQTGVDIAFPEIHTHHIVMQNGRQNVASAVRHSHLILRSVGIDPYFNTINLAREPQWPNHYNKPTYALQVDKDLSAIIPNPNNNPTAETIAAMGKYKIDVVNKLNEIAQEFFVATYNMAAPAT